MRKINIKSIEKQVSVLGLGTMIFAPQKKDSCFEILNNYKSHGGTFIDTAEIYGDPEEYGYSETTIGMWLEETNARDDMCILSKGLIPDTCKSIHPNGLKIAPKYIHDAISGSLDRLRTSYLDIWLFHRDDPSVEVGKLVEACNKEIEEGRISAYGASNWSVERIEKANNYAKSHNLKPMSISSPHFSLAVAQEPYWPNTEVVSSSDKIWYENNKFPLLAWSSLGRGFIAKGAPNYTEDKDLVRVYYNSENFERLKRAEEIGKEKGLNKIEIALSYVLSQSFSTIALVGAENKNELLSCIKAADTILTKEEVKYLNLDSNSLNNK